MRRSVKTVRERIDRANRAKKECRARSAGPACGAAVLQVPGPSINMSASNAVSARGFSTLRQTPPLLLLTIHSLPLSVSLSFYFIFSLSSSSCSFTFLHFILYTRFAHFIYTFEYYGNVVDRVESETRIVAVPKRSARWQIHGINEIENI